MKEQRVRERLEYSWKFPHDLRLRIRDREDGEVVVSIESTGTGAAEVEIVSAEESARQTGRSSPCARRF